MMAWYDIALPAFFWILAIYLWRPSTLRRADWRDRRVLGSRIFALCLAISLTIQADPLGMHFDRAVGIHNLSWIVGYLNGVVAIYAGTAAMAVIRHKVFPNWLTWVTVGALAGFSLLLSSVVAAPEELHDQLSRSLPLLLLREVMYIYLFVIAVYGVRTFHTWMQAETHPTGHVREGLLLGAFVSGFIFAAMRAVALVIVYFDTAWELYGIAVKASNAVLVLSITASVLGMAPISWLRVPVMVVGYIQQQWTLHHLQRLRARLVAVTGELQWLQPSQRDRWLNPPFVLYCTLIDILDRRMLLQSNLQQGDTTLQPAHHELAAVLAELPETHDWVELAQYLRQVARKM